MQATWDKVRLESYIGTSESIRMEFKSAKLLSSQNGTLDREKVIRDLTKEVSAFANSEGGEIILGMEERKDKKTRLADRLQGFDPTGMPKEQLQQLIEGNLRPLLTGLRFQYIGLDSSPAGQVACVIEVPKGNTAYQASDCIYYGRSEFEAKALPDHEVRLRMNRGRVPRLDCLLSAIKSIAPQDHPAVNDVRRQLMAVRSQPSPQDVHRGALQKLLNSLESVKQSDLEDYPAFEFTLAVHNLGEITVPDFLCEVRFTTTPPSLLFSKRKRVECPSTGRGYNYEYADPDPHHVWRFESSDFAVQEMNTGHRLYPGTTAVLRNQPWFLLINTKAGLEYCGVRVNWTLYADHTLPVLGEIDVQHVIRTTFTT